MNEFGPRTLGQLVTDATSQLSSLVRYEIALAKAEASSQLRRVKASALFVAAALFLLHLAIIMGMFALAYGLAALGLPTWASFGILSLVLLLIVALLLLLAWRSGKKAARFRTVESLKDLSNLAPNRVPASTRRDAEDDDDDWIF